MAKEPTKNGTMAPATPAEQPASQFEKTVEYVPFMQDEPIKLSAGLVTKYLCKPTKAGKVCSQEQAIRFVMLCVARKLNPFEGDAFIVGYDGQDGPEFSLITAHQAFLKRAEAHVAFDGMDSGVLVVRNGETVELHGDFHNGDDVLVGAWAKVYRRDRTRPTYRRLKLATFSTGRSRWAKDPAGMIVKCAEADALRSTFPNNLAGMYAEEEMGGKQTAPAKQAPRERVAGLKGSVPEAIAERSAPIPTVVVTPAEKVPAESQDADKPQPGDPDADPYASGEIKDGALYEGTEQRDTIKG